MCVRWPLASFVTDAQQAVAARVRPPPGYTISEYRARAAISSWSVANSIAT
jgi:hypothetical protein